MKPHDAASQVKHIHARLHHLCSSMSRPHRLAHSSSSHLAKLLMFKFHAEDLWITHPCCQTTTCASPCQSSLAQRQTLPNTFPITLIPPLYVSALLLCRIIPALFLPPLLSSCHKALSFPSSYLANGLSMNTKYALTSRPWIQHRLSPPIWTPKRSLLTLLSGLVAGSIITTLSLVFLTFLLALSRSVLVPTTPNPNI